VSGGDTRFIRQRVGINARPPLGRQESCLSRQVMSGLLNDARVQLNVDYDDDRDHHYRYDRERLEKQSVRELHDRSLTFRMR
jgi:hypothetical protein